jgi:hypothetical protein
LGSVRLRQTRSGLGWGLATVIVGVSAAWPATAGDCAQTYHAALAQISSRQIVPALDALVVARRAAPGLPGHWLFGPYAKPGRPLPKAAIETTTRSALDFPGDTARQELALYQHAEPLVGASGHVARLHPQAPFGSAAYRVGRELRGYTSQPFHPALCTGSSEILEHFTRQSAQLKRPLQGMQANVQTGIALAGARVAALREQAVKSGGKPALVTGAIAAGSIDRPPSTAAEAALRPMIVELAGVLLTPDGVREVSAQDSALMALRELHLARTQRAVAVQSESIRKAADDALGIVEAAAYLAHSGALHTQVGDGLLGGVQAIREAHAASCTCPQVAIPPPQPAADIEPAKPN